MTSLNQLTTDMASMSVNNNCVDHNESENEENDNESENEENDNESICDELNNVKVEIDYDIEMKKPLKKLWRTVTKKKKKLVIVPDEKDFRDNVIEIFKPILNSYSTAANLESAIFDFTAEKYFVWNNILFRNLYRAKVRSAKFNLTNNNNTKFIDRILKNKSLVNEIPYMKNYEIFPELYESIFENIAKKKLDQDSFTKTKTCGLFTCEKCKSNETTYYEMQTRSADEPMTAFISCLNCENRWKI